MIVETVKRWDVKDTATYADLPTETDLESFIVCANIDCEALDQPCSANRGDYFLHTDSDTVCCGECDEPMILVKRLRS